jgi:hypothetical protein
MLPQRRAPIIRPFRRLIFFGPFGSSQPFYFLALLDRSVLDPADTQSFAVGSIDHGGDQVTCAALALLTVCRCPADTDLDEDARRILEFAS